MAHARLLQNERTQVLSHTRYAKRVCCGAKLTEKCFHISLLFSFNSVVRRKAKDYFVTSNLNAMNSRNTGVRAVV